MTTELDRNACTAHVAITGGGGTARSSDGHRDLDLRPPQEMGGPSGSMNPEQLLAAGYAACCQSGLRVAGPRSGVDASTSVVTAKDSMGPVGEAFGLADAAHRVWSYSNAKRGNIAVEIRARVAG